MSDSGATMDATNGAAPAILVIDEHSVYRRGLRAIIEAHIVPSRVIEAAALDCVDWSLRFDLILIDGMGVSPKSIEHLKEMHEMDPQTRMAVMSVSNTRADVINCLAAGFHGFIYKLQADSEFLAAVQDLLSGRIYVPRWLADAQEQRAELPPSVNVHGERLKLTPRQCQIMSLLAEGFSNKQMARALCIAPGTAKIHTTALLRVLGARNRTEAAFLAAQLLAPSGLNPPQVASKFSIKGSVRLPRSA
jgi:DNA-binding NarL/FixJ family response regulator